MINQFTLNEISNKIEDRLKHLGMPMVCTDGRVYPIAGYVELYLSTKQGDKVSKVDQILAAQRDIAHAIGYSDVRVYQNSQAKITVEIQIQAPQEVTMSQLPNVEPHVLVLGRDKAGQMVLFDLRKPECAHLLISGSTGSGKTALAHAMLIHASKTNTPSELQIIVIDYNNEEQDWLYQAVDNHVALSATNIEHATKILTNVATKMFNKKSRDKIIIFIDELADLVTNSAEALRAIETIAQQGRKYGVHLLCCTQKPTAKHLGSLMKANMRKVVGKVASIEDSRVATGISGVGAESLLGNGQFIYVDKDLVRFQSALPERYGVYDIAPNEQEVFDLSVIDEEVNQDGINVSRCVHAANKLKYRNLQITKGAVLRELGYKQAGGASRRINKLWPEVLKALDQSQAGLTPLPSKEQK